MIFILQYILTVSFGNFTNLNVLSIIIVYPEALINVQNLYIDDSFGDTIS